MSESRVAWLAAGVTAGAVLVLSARVSSAQGRPQSPFGDLRRQGPTGSREAAPGMLWPAATPQAVTASVRVNDVTAGGQHLPTVTVGPGGQVYVAWVDCPADQECTTANPDIYLARSTDGGRHFSARVLVSDDGAGAFANNPRIATDHDGTIYVVWHDDRAATPSDASWDVYLSRSTDGGLTFSPSVRVSEHVPNAYQYEPDLAVGTDGTIYVSWQRYAYDGTLGQWDSDVHVARSTDGGSSFGPSVKVSDAVNNQFKSTVGVGPSGNVYVAWSDFRADSSGDVYFARSTNGGASFSANIRVNSTTSQAQVYPELAIDGNERVYVAWVDARRTGDGANDVYMARSADLGLTFGAELRVSDTDLPANAAVDYLYPVITAAGNGFVAVAWYDDHTGDWDTYMTRSFDAGLSVLPSWRVNDLLANSQSVPDVFMAPDLNVRCVYRDRSSGDFDIYFVLDTTLTATQTLSVARSGTGSGKVTSDPAGIDCGATCSASFASNRVVTLAAATDPGSIFAGWSGEGCSGTGTCVLTMSQARSVTAAFGIQPPGGADFYAVTPCRLLDTRGVSAPSLAAGGTRTFTVTGACAVPADAKALTVNATVTHTTGGPGHLRLWPGDGAMPVASTINFQPGQTRANNATVALAGNGSGTIKVFNAAPGTVDFILDVSGYYR